MIAFRVATIPLAGSALILALTLTGCAPATGPTGGGSPKQTSASSPANTPEAHPQGKFTGVPVTCPSTDDVSLAVHVLMPHVSTTTISGGLNCEYYVDGNSGSPVVNMLFHPLGGISVADWKSAVAAQPGASLVPGVGDGASFQTTATYHEFNFVSGTTACNVTAPLSFDEAHLIALAVSTLEG